MTTLTREQFYVCRTSDKAMAVKVDGYKFEVEVRPEMPWPFGTYKDDSGRWQLVDAMTGLSVCGTMRTRRECIEMAESDAMKQRLFDYYIEHTETYLAKAEVLTMLISGVPVTYSEYVVTIDEIAAMKREAAEAEQVAEVAAEAVVVTLASMKEKAWPDVLVQQKREGACIWVTGSVAEHTEELKELGFRPGRSKEYGRGWWLKPVEA